MSNPHRSYLPPEIFDEIVDLLYSEREVLKQCCLVSRSWIPRARKYLFADINFIDEDDIKAWRKRFPDPTRSPAHHTRKMKIHCAEVVTAEDVQEGAWLQTFSSVVWLELRTGLTSFNELTFSLVPFYKFSSSVKSLVCVHFIPCLQTLWLIHSLPLLENLTLDGRVVVGWGLPPGSTGLSVSPPLTGTLELALSGGVESIARRLLDLPNGLHFRRLIFSWRNKEGSRWANELAAACSNTLECLDVMAPLFYDFEPDAINLSKATKLANVIFRPGSMNVGWITRVLHTITPEHRDLRHISIYMYYNLFPARVDGNIGHAIGEGNYGQWLELDRLLVQLWESHSIRTRLICTILTEQEQELGDYFGCLFPEITKRGIVDLVEPVL